MQLDLGVRAVVKSHVGLGGTNVIILDDVKDNFVSDSGYETLS